MKRKRKDGKGMGTMDANLTPTSRMAAMKSSSRGNGHRKRLFSSFLRSRGFLLAVDDEAMEGIQSMRRVLSSFFCVFESIVKVSRRAEQASYVHKSRAR